MFKLSQSLKRMIPVLVILCTGVVVIAGSWNWSAPYKGPHKDIITLMITSNYTKPRLLSDLIQSEIRQPYILLPTTEKGKIFFVPYKKAALEIHKDHLARFIKFVNPKQIIVMGNRKYVPEEYIKMIDPTQTVWILTNEKWDKAAESAGKLLNITYLADDYRRLQSEIDSGSLYKPTKPQKKDALDDAESVDALLIEETEGTEILLDPPPEEKFNEMPEEREMELDVPEKGPILIEDNKAEIIEEPEIIEIPGKTIELDGPGKSEKSGTP